MTGIWARYQNRRDPVSLSLYLQVRDREGVPREAYQTERIAPEVFPVKDIDLETPPATVPANPALFVRR